MVKPIPENIKNTLSELSAAQQVAIRGYIGTLRAEIKGLEEEIRTLQDPDPHAHYHGHEKCTGEFMHERPYYSNIGNLESQQDALSQTIVLFSLF